MLRCTPIRLLVFISLVSSISGCGAEPAATARPAASAKPASPARPAAPVMPASVQKPASNGELTLIDAVNRSDLAKVVRTELSPDAKFLYATCWTLPAVDIYPARTGYYGLCRYLKGYNQVHPN